MKNKIFMFVALFGLPIIVNSKSIPESEIPAAVKSYVTNNYPNAVDKEWDYKNKNNSLYYYEVEFQIEGREVELKLDTKGQLISSEEDILLKDAPSFISPYINKNYSNSMIQRVKKKNNSGSISYSVRISFDKNGKTRYRSIYFDAKGNVIRQ